MRSHFQRRDLPPLQEARSHAAALSLLLEGRVLVAGGGTRRASERPTGECEVRCWSTGALDVVDIARAATLPLSPLRKARESARIALVNGTVFVAGGHADNG